METKKWYQSKTIWGVAIAALGFVMTNIIKVDGVELPTNPDFEQLKNYTEQIKVNQNSWTNLFGSLISVFGYVLALIGRVKADTKITK